MCKFKAGDQLLFAHKGRTLEILGVFDRRECGFDGFTKVYMYRDMDSKGIIRYCDAAVIDDERELIDLI